MKHLNRQIDTFYSKILELLKSAQNKVYQSVNSTMVDAYYQIGKIIIDEEQQGKEKAKYGQNLINGLSQRLSEEFGKGASAWGSYSSVSVIILGVS